MQIPSPQTRLDFVIKNFLLTYSSDFDKKIEIDYGIRQNTAIFCPDHFYKFCEISLIELANNCNWIEIKEQKIPIFFTPNIKEPYNIQDKKITFTFDIISHIFFYLSGYQEVINKDRDKLNRFGYSQSLQKILNNSHIPIVNYLFEILKSAIEKSTGIIYTCNYNPNQSFYTWITHDVDILKNIGLKNIKNALKTGDINSFFSSLKNRKKIDLCFENISKLQEKFGFDSTYFFMTKTGKYKNYENADYDIQITEIQEIINKLKQKNRIGLHTGFGSTESETDFKSELSILKTKIHRSHFLMFDILKTPQILAKNNIKYDSSLGFYDFPGFRNSTSLPFYLFDFQENITLDTIEIPLVIMDSSLFYEHYLNLKTENEATQIIEPILSEMQKMGGILTINFHNHGFAENKLKFWNFYFENLLKILTKKHAIMKVSNFIKL